MSATRRIRVISEGERIVGIFAPYPPPAAAGGPTAELRAGPGQREHEIDVAWPAEREPAAIGAALLADIQKALKLK
jgi:hypothetical protein